MTNPDAEHGQKQQASETLSQFFQSMSGPQLGTLSFNLGGIAWVGLNMAFGPNYLPYYQPCAYLTAGPWVDFCLMLFVLAFVFSVMAIRKKSLLPAFLTLTFAWALIASVVRQFIL